MIFETWFLDATRGGPPYIFVPGHLDENDVVTNLWEGFTFIGDDPPHGRVVAIIHTDGADAVSRWCQEHPEVVKRFERKE